MKFIFLTDAFFNDYKDCTEMERKKTRPYACVCLIELEEKLFAIPMRHSIKHNNAVFTNKEKTQGLDLSKAVLIKDKEKYIDKTRVAYISKEEYKILVNKKYFIENKLLTYIKKYKKAYSNRQEKHNEIFCKMSCLQYFHDDLDIDN